MKDQTRTSKSFPWTCLPQQALCPCRTLLWMHLPEHADIDPTWRGWGPGSAQEPPAVPREGGWDGHRADVVPLCPGHLPGTHLQLPWLGNHDSPPAPQGLELWEGKAQGSSAGTWARCTQAAASEWKLQPVLFKTPCLGSHLGTCATQCPCGGGYYIPSLPCYFWMLKEQRTNILLSSAQLVQEESVRDGSAAHPHTSSSCGTADFWQWLMTCTKPCYQEPNGFFFMSCPLSGKLHELLG